MEDIYYCIEVDAARSETGNLADITEWLNRTIAGALQVPPELLQSTFQEDSRGLTYRAIIHHHLANTPIGDTSCKFNAQSPYLRCAVNPQGSCDGCIYFEKRENG